MFCDIILAHTQKIVFLCYFFVVSAENMHTTPFRQTIQTDSLSVWHGHSIKQSKTKNQKPKKKNENPQTIRNLCVYR